MTKPDFLERVRAALAVSRIVDITTTGRRSGNPTRIEIWAHPIRDRIIITGTSGPRNWLANMRANPDFTLHIKHADQLDLAARAVEITDAATRREIMSASETEWYRGQESVDSLVAGSPMVEVFLTDDE